MFCNDFSNKKRLIPVTHLPPLLFRVDAAAAVRIYPVESSGMALFTLFHHNYRSAQNIKCAALKFNGNPPPPKLKLLGRIGSFFWREALHGNASWAPRRFLNFCLGAEIWGPPLALDWARPGQKMIKNFFSPIRIFFHRTVFCNVSYVPNDHFWWCSTHFIGENRVFQQECDQKW